MRIHISKWTLVALIAIGGYVVFAAGPSFLGDVFQPGARVTTAFPSPSPFVGAVLYDSDAGTLRVAQQGAWTKLLNADEGQAGNVFFMGSSTSQTNAAQSPGGGLFFDSSSRYLGLGTTTPQNLLTLDRDAGNILIRGYGDQRVIWEQRGVVGSGSDLALNPKFSWGSIIAGGIATPEIRLLYSDEGSVSDGGAPRGERAVFEIERTGTAAAVGDGNRRALYEGYIQNGDYKPVFRLSSYQQMQLELGAGGTVSDAGSTIRTGGNLVTVIGNPNYAHGFQVGDHVYQAFSEADFPLPTAPDYHIVTSTPAYNQFTYLQSGSNVSSTIPLYYSISPDTFTRRPSAGTMTAVVAGQHIQTMTTADGGTGGPFTATLSYVPLTIGSVLVQTTDGGILAYDNGGGGFSGTNVSAGSIDYTSGAISVTFSVAPTTGTILQANYFDDAARHTWTSTTSKVSDYIVFGLPKWPTSSLPSAASYEGYLVYDDTANTIKWSNGSSWTSGGGGGGGYDTVSLNGVALPQETTLEFSGAYWSITDSAPKTIFTLLDADTTNAGLLNAGAQTIGGRKQFPGTAITTDPSFTVASIDQLPSFTKNDGNTRVFYGSRIKPQFNFGGSNSSTTVTILEVSSTDTSTTGLSDLYLLNLAQNDATQFRFGGTGALEVQGSAGNIGDVLTSQGSGGSPVQWAAPFKPTPNQADATGDDSTSSASDALMGAMTFTAVSSGPHFITFSGSIESTDAAAVTEISVYVNSIQYTNTIRTLTTAVNAPVPASISTVTGITSGDVIEVQWNTTSGTATVHERTLSVISFQP